MKIGIVLGGAVGVWEELARVRELTDDRYDCLIACNEAGADCPIHVDVMCSLHPDKFAIWAERRGKQDLPPWGEIVGPAELSKRKVKHKLQPDRWVKYRWDSARSGSSGLFAVKIAIDDLGLDRVILCGIPMTSEGSHYFKPETKWASFSAFTKAWEDVHDKLKDRVRSMSGATRKWFGPPDRDWLQRDKEKADMPRVRFTDNFDYWPRNNVTQAFKKGMERLVPQRCADQAVAAGKAVLITRAAAKEETTNGPETAGR